jgi:hypothetical protein
LTRQCGVAAALAAALVCAAVSASAESRADADRWVPGIALYFDVVGQRIEGTTTTGRISGPPLPAGCDDANGLNGDLCTDPFGLDAEEQLSLSLDSRGSDTPVSTLVGGSLELMTPRLFDGFLDPRLFIHGDVSAAFAHERTASGFGEPGVLAVPPVLIRNEEANNVPNVTEIVIQGQGQQANFQVQRWILSGGAGLAFGFQLFDRPIRIRPSFEYIRQEIEMNAALHRAVKLRDPVRPSEFQSGFRNIVLTAEEDATLHGVGPGLEIEADASRIGPFQLSIFGRAAGYRFLGNLDHALTAGSAYCDPSNFANTECVRWRIELDPWLWRAGMGIRFRWIPDDE